MAAKKKTKTPSRAQETTFRHLWLAGLGAIAVARRETRNIANDAVARVESLKQQAGKLANDAQANVRGGIASVREQGEAKASQFSAEVEARLAPVLVKLGLKPKATKAARGRKPIKKAAAKRTTRATPARKKPAAKRTVRKTRA
ncbi:hypothetical protein CSC74_03590 [Pseudoxanthomonas yeongjuensis]|uniref:phasin family protein n=1 Tax=Pseudoxanthomonas yeongjuensis TaxID=377616 RepID=UPI00139195A1|nr:phasin family protein [Pseudoxanthomonas yeongjuensis]KAF1717993.1 hypothetical protein CSC74_03590 [Pseudoxanthomonas yeongjuensis]